MPMRIVRFWRFDVAGADPARVGVTLEDEHFFGQHDRRAEPALLIRVLAVELDEYGVVDVGPETLEEIAALLY